METSRPVHTDFLRHLDRKSPELVERFYRTREFVLNQHIEAVELLYHTHALTAVFSLSERLSDAYCHIPVYTAHLNLGFNKGVLLADPKGLLQGSGKLIRHIPIKTAEDLNNPYIRILLENAIDLAQADLDKPAKSRGITLSRIKD